MNKIFCWFLVFVMLIGLISCGETPKLDPLYHVAYQINKIEYETLDGTWNQSNVRSMIDRYYDQKCESIDITITVTYTAKEAFTLATLEGKMGIGETSGSSYLFQKYSVTMDAQNIGLTQYEAGEHTITLFAKNVRFFAYKTLFIPFDRNGVDIRLSLDLTRPRESSKS